jgi:hypothetical protein
MTQMRTSESKVDTSGVPFAITDRWFIPREGYFDRTSSSWRLESGPVRPQIVGALIGATRSP